MIVDDLVTRPGSWLALDKDTGVVISSRVRLARNIRNFAFPGWASEDECVRVSRHIKEVFGQLKSMPTPVIFDMPDLSDIDRDVLKERHLISQELMEKGAGSSLIVDEGEGLAVMVNEEDHLRLQAISPGKRLLEEWARLNALDTELGEHLDFAFSDELGFLTACPTNLGTGLRASVMMHLSGLKLTGDLGSVIKGIERLGFAVRGLFGEGTEAFGNMFQISNECTLGRTEQELVDGLSVLADEVAVHEVNARERLREGRRTLVYDHVGRSLGMLLHARIVTSQEAVELLSGLRLGLDMKILSGMTITGLNETMLHTQPGHLQKTARRAIGAEERDMMRADSIRSRLKHVVMSDE